MRSSDAYDRHDRSSSQVNSLSLHLVQKSPVRSTPSPNGISELSGDLGGYLTCSISPGPHVLSNHGSSGPLSREDQEPTFFGMVCIQLFSSPSGDFGPKSEHRDADRLSARERGRRFCGELAARRGCGRLGCFRGGGGLCDQLATHVWCPATIYAAAIRSAWLADHEEIDRRHLAKPAPQPKQITHRSGRYTTARNPSRFNSNM